MESRNKRSRIRSSILERFGDEIAAPNGIARRLGRGLGAGQRHTRDPQEPGRTPDSPSKTTVGRPANNPRHAMAAPGLRMRDELMGAGRYGQAKETKRGGMELGRRSLFIVPVKSGNLPQEPGGGKGGVWDSTRCWETRRRP
jgi:hypothetical protein